MRAFLILAVASPAIASPFPAPPAVPKDLALDYSSIVLHQVRGEASADKRLALCPYERAACEAACTAGSQLSCTRLGVVLTRAKDTAAAKKVLASACAKKTWSACILLVDLEEITDGNSLQSGCKAGHAMSCATIVHRAMGDDPVVPYNELGCKAGDGAACLRLAETAKPAAARAYVTKALATGARMRIGLTCSGKAKPVNLIELRRGVAPRPVWACMAPSADGTNAVRSGLFMAFATEEDARDSAGVVAERGTLPAGPFDSFDERGRLTQRRQYALNASGDPVQVGDSFEMTYDDAGLVSIKRVTWVDGKPRNARELHRTPVESIESGDASPTGAKSGVWLRVRAGRVVGQTTYRNNQRDGEAIEWNEKGAFVSQTTYERDVAIRRRIPKGAELVDDPTFTRAK